MDQLPNRSKSNEPISRKQPDVFARYSDMKDRYDKIMDDKQAPQDPRQNKSRSYSPLGQNKNEISQKLESKYQDYIQLNDRVRQDSYDQLDKDQY